MCIVNQWMSWDNEHVTYFSICYIYTSLWPLMENFPFHCNRRKFFLIVAQQFEVGVVVFLEENHSSVLLYLESILSDISVLCSWSSESVRNPQLGVRSSQYFNPISPHFQSWLESCHEMPIKKNVFLNIIHMS